MATAPAAKRGRGRPPKAETVIARAAIAAVQEHAAQIAAEPRRQVVRNRYDAAGQGRRFAGWQAPGTGPNQALKNLQTIRNRARDSRRNDWAGESANQKWSTNLVGIGITPRFNRLNETRKQEVTDLFLDFVKEADADGVLDLFGLQTLAVESWLDSGEVFVRKRPRFLDEGLAVPLQVQLIESDQCPLFDADEFDKLPITNKIRSGIELNKKRNTRVAYWFYKEHPGDNIGTMVQPTSDQLVRVPASEVRHMFKPTRPGQLRGVSLLAPILGRLRTIENYEDATLVRQQLANMVVAFIVKKLPQLTQDQIDALTGGVQELDPEGKPLLGLQPGLVQELEDGQEVQWSNPPEAGTNYSEYIRTMQMGTAAGSGMPYEIFSGDIKEVSDRTLRVMINEFRRLAEQRQWQIIIPMFCQPIIEWFAEALVLAGSATPDEYELIRRVEHAPHGWAYIHPVQDPQGKKLEVEAGFRSRSSVISAQGDDPEKVDKERAKDMEREKALDLWVDPNPQAAGAAEDEDGIDNNEYAAPPTAQAELLQRAVNQMQSQNALIEDMAAQLKATQADLAKARQEMATTSVQDRLLAMLETTGGPQ